MHPTDPCYILPAAILQAALHKGALECLLAIQLRPDVQPEVAASLAGKRLRGWPPGWLPSPHCGAR